jgi:hypothetical protein
VSVEKLDEVMDKYRPEGRDGHGPGGRGPGRAGRRGRQGHRPGDGGPLAKYDVNKDGQLDATERAALKADIDSGAFPPGPSAAAASRCGHGRPGSAPGADNAPTVIGRGPRR